MVIAQNLPVDILADVVNLEICEIAGLESCDNDVLQVRAIVNGRICLILYAMLYMRAPA